MFLKNRKKNIENHHSGDGPAANAAHGPSQHFLARAKSSLPWPSRRCAHSARLGQCIAARSARARGPVSPAAPGQLLWTRSEPLITIGRLSTLLAGSKCGGPTTPSKTLVISLPPPRLSRTRSAAPQPAALSSARCQVRPPAWLCRGHAQEPGAFPSLSVHPPFCRVTRSGGGRFGSPEEAAALVQIPSPARALARVRARRHRAGLHRCPSPHVEQRLGSSSPNTEAMSPRRADALAFLSAQPWTAVEQQQVRALCSFFVRVSDCFQLSTSIRDRVASCSVSVSVDSQTNPFQIDLLDRSALVPLLDYRDRLGCRSNWRNSLLWVKPLFATIRGAAVVVDEVAPELEKRSWTATSLCRGTGVVVQWWRQWSIPSLATLP